MEAYKEFMKKPIVYTTKEGKKKEKYLQPGTVSNYMRGLRSLFNKAKAKYNCDDLDIIRIPNNPYTKVSIPEYQRKRKNLSIGDVIRIRDGQFSTYRANMARDVFMIMFYLMGINAQDLFQLISETNGRIEYERNKVQVEGKKYFPLSIKIEPELRLLMNQYTGKEFLSYIKVRYSCFNNFLRAVNKGLRKISSELGLNVDLSTNWARHSWASIARNKAGISKADIDFCLGHVNNDYKMADIYIDIDYSIYDEVNRKVLDLLLKETEKTGKKMNK